MTMDHDFATEVARAAPASTVTGLMVLGIPLNEWVMVFTLLLIFAQIFFLVRDKWYIPRKHKGSNYGRRQ